MKDRLLWTFDMDLSCDHAYQEVLQFCRRSGNEELSPSQVKDWVQGASEARKRSHSPYSHYPVGASALTKDGRWGRGSNQENASFGGTVCAERVAIWGLAGAGMVDAERNPLIAVAVNTPVKTRPCLFCWGVMMEFMPQKKEGEFLVLGTDDSENMRVQIYSIAALREMAFNASDLTA